MFWASLTSRGVNRRTSLSGLNRELACLHRRKLEAEMALLAAKPRRLRPVLTLDVIDDGALVPSQQRWDHQADAFAAPRWRERENVFRAVVAEVTQPVSALRAPSTDIDASLCVQETGLADVVFVGPSRGSVQVLRVLR